MDFRQLSFDRAPSIVCPPPGPKSKELLDFQAAQEGGTVSYPKGLPMALQRGRGATVEDVALMSRLVKSHGLGVKASGGIRSLADLRRMVQAGATRIGTSSGIKILQEAAGQAVRSEGAKC